MINKSLTLCSEGGYSSIAFPAVGMGTKGYPSNVVAETLLRALEDHCLTDPTSSIKRVALYLHPELTSKPQLKVRSDMHVQCLCVQILHASSPIEIMLWTQLHCNFISWASMLYATSLHELLCYKAHIHERIV